MAAVLLVGTGIATAAEPADNMPVDSAAAIELFEKHVRPLLVDRCLECHAAKAEGDFRLDSREGMLSGGFSGPAVVPGDAGASLLVKAVRHVDDELKMPPDGKLADDAIAPLADWISRGAPWPSDAVIATGEGAPDAWKSHWAFQPLEAPPQPAVKQADWPQTPLDVFVLAQLEGQGLAPSPPADRRTLIRRASYDLLGLPPTAEEVEAFANDPNPRAFDRVIERLLASPHYGERWARHWLDVARYADTKGYVFTADRNYPNAYRYRDWVVQAFNRDMPYDQFLVEQIAADCLPGDDKSRLAAMGFLTVGRRFLNNQHDIIDDRIDVLTRGTMGLTVTCARCHDHKYDPIPTEDYYSLYGVLASSIEPAEPAEYMTLADAEQPVNPHVFVRGNSGNPGPEVPRQFLKLLSGESRQPFADGSGRLELAQAIASRHNPLTPRVIVNRLWLQYFDKPLVETPSDFGVRSAPPTHPALLDHLAASLVNDGWSLKHLARVILRSATYQQASFDRPECRAIDPENKLLWRMNRKRLDFEGLRDALLAVSGQLDDALGGPAVTLTATPWPRRRTLYGSIDRQNLPNLFRTFDFASPDTHSPQRFRTTVPQQALYLMNSPFLGDQVRALAELAQQQAGDAPGRIAALYRLALARNPSEQELALGQAFLEDESAREPSELPMALPASEVAAEPSAAPAAAETAAQPAEDKPADDKPAGGAAEPARQQESVTKEPPSSAPL
ncbi:MAG: PSD1 and planctomycete cytochrome C domain-containing protein, partial [Pirellulales bacterium]